MNKPKCVNCLHFDFKRVMAKGKGNCFINPINRRGVTPPCEFYSSRQGRLV